MFDPNEILNSNLNPLERARLIQMALTADNYSKKELAGKIKKSSSYISNHLRLLKLPEIIKEALLSKTINEGQARALSFLETDALRLKVFEDILKFNYSVRQVEQAVNRLRIHKKEYGKVSWEIKDNVKRIASLLESEVKVTRRSQKVVVSLYFPLGFVAHQKIRRLLSALKKAAEEADSSG